MCELLGMSANVPTDICFSFTGLVQRGGGTGPHKDGWGITFYEGKGCRTFKDPQPSYHSPIAKLVQNYPIKSCSVIAHIRQANRGEVALENTHLLPGNYGDATGLMLITVSSTVISRWKPVIFVRWGNRQRKSVLLAIA